MLQSILVEFSFKMFSFFLFWPPQVFPTATRAIGIGTSSGMARVGALITPFIAQVEHSSDFLRRKKV